MKTEDTIIALSTAAGRAALGVVRLSGNEVLNILNQYCIDIQCQEIDFSKKVRRAVHCQILSTPSAASSIEKRKDSLVENSQFSHTDTIVDQGVVIYYAAPHSYTGEDVAEFFLHGNDILLREFISVLLNQEDIRMARPGEFTKRAFLSGKLQLSQAEAVHRMISAQSSYELQLSRKNLYGLLHHRFSELRSALIHFKAELEAELDFSTEGLMFGSKEDKLSGVKKLIEQIELLLANAKENKNIVKGFNILIVGLTNAGKSSLFNQILARNRSIVSEQEGTTRDYIDETLELEGIPMHFIDTAGLRNTKDFIEEQGIALVQEKIQKCDCILHVLDGSKNIEEIAQNYNKFAEESVMNVNLKNLLFTSDQSNTFIAEPNELTKTLLKSKKVIHIINKADLESAKDLYQKYNNEEILLVSCHKSTGIENLKKTLLSRMLSNPEENQSLLLEERHIAHLNLARRHLEKNPNFTF